jgi:hypothetical protein
MSKRFLTSVAAIALIAGVGAVNAQGTKSEGGGAAMSPGSSSTSGGTGAASHESTGATKGAEKSPGATGGQRAEDTKGGAKDMKNGQRAEENKTGAKDMKAEGREGRDKNMKAEGREGRDNNMKAEGREGRDNNMKAEGREGGRTQTTGQAGANAKLSTEQRTRITSVIRDQRVESVDHVNFAISVGTRVPREGVRFYPLPAEVVTIYPEWRGYEFIRVRDEILVIDPNTYEIVAVLNT